ncbi:hypothetical protein [Azospirillum sp.]|uniref:hypothetical protein n=1 Tax=Azospirillum sp. TaxID=34012 RepID=UPI003D7566E4
MEGAGSLSFTLSAPTKLLNQLLRMHWSKRRKHQQALSWEVKILTSGKRPAVPFARAKVRVERHSLREPDVDGMIGGFKHLLDCLLPHSDRHPNGLGIIADDNPRCLQLEPVSVLVKHRADQKTVVLIEEQP